MPAERRARGGANETAPAAAAGAAAADAPRFWEGQPIFFSSLRDNNLPGPFCGFVNSVMGPDELRVECDPAFALGNGYPDSSTMDYYTPVSEAWPRMLLNPPRKPLTVPQKELLREELQELAKRCKANGGNVNAIEDELAGFDNKSEEHLRLRYAELVTRNARYRLPPHWKQSAPDFPCVVDWWPAPSDADD